MGRLVVSAMIAIVPTILLVRLHPAAGVTPPEVETWPLEFGAITVDSNETMFVAVPGYGKVYVYSSQGEFLRKFWVGSAQHLEVDGMETLHVIRAKESGERYTYDRQGKLLSHLPKGPTVDPADSDRFTAPSGATFVLDQRFGQARVLRQDASGNQTVVVDRSLERGIAQHPWLACGIVAIYAACTLVIFRLAGIAARRSRQAF